MLCGMLTSGSNSASHHGLPRSRGAVQQHSPGWLNSNLPVQVEMGKGKLNSFSNLLLLHVASSNISICDIRLLPRLHHLDGGVRLRGQSVNHAVTVSVQSHARAGLE